MVIPRPRFTPIPYDAGTSSGSALSSDGLTWFPLLSCTADFPLELFELAISQLIHHPEYNSTLILRSETISDTISDFPSLLPRIHGLLPCRNIIRKLLPRRPGRDAGLEQHCTLYGNDTDIPTTLVLTPIIHSGSSLPYYHPTVFHLAFRYILSSPPIIQIEVVPLPNTPTDQNSRLYRTCLALLDTLHRYGWGAMTNYKKRVMHDCVVPREVYQDLYLVMRERHKGLVDTWHEVTDPLKHVFEDIGIATFLMLLWKDTFTTTGASVEKDQTPLEDRPWINWSRPPGGFLDFGCGNGLLTHILTAEGYDGHGIDLRARSSWAHYPDSTRARLHVHAFDPTQQHQKDPFLQEGVFIIGNHADELTPWLPVLSTLHAASGYLSIPCCAWSFDTRYERSSKALLFHPPSSADFADKLNLGGDGNNTSSYSMYRIWLASLSLHCGWEVECETLRIPSTRNWAVIGRKKIASTPDEENDARRNAGDIVNSVKERGIFKARTPEGKAVDH